MPIISPGMTVQTESGITTRIQSYYDQIELECTRCYIEPKYENSKFMIEVNLPTNTSDDSDAYGGDANPYWGAQIQRSINGGSFSNADYRGNASGYRNVHMEISPWRAGDANPTYGFNPGRRYRMKPNSANIIDEPSYSLGDYIIYRVFLNDRGLDNRFIQFGAPHGFGSDNNYINFPYGIIVSEIQG